MKITQHGIQCLICGDEIYSMYRHDYKQCSCGNAMIDGGFDYNRYGAMDMDKIKHIERSISVKKLKDREYTIDEIESLFLKRFPKIKITTKTAKKIFFES